MLSGAGWFVYRDKIALPHAHSDVNYIVSLGDSVAAGAGLLAVSNPSQADTACNRSIQAYPEVLAQNLNTPLKQFACSGAQVIAGVVQPQAAKDVTIPAQLDAATPYLKGNDVIVTVGANDVGWSDMLQRCARSMCNSDADLQTYQQDLQNLAVNLDSIYKTIHDAKPHAFLINAYYSILSPTDTCFAAFGITQDKIQWVVDREAELNTVIAGEARKYSAKLITPDFSRHLLCDTDPWLQGLLGDAPLHPTVDGQKHIAQQDADTLR